MDPFNGKVSKSENYMKAIIPIMRWISDPNYLKEALIRSVYFIRLGLFHELSADADARKGFAQRFLGDFYFLEKYKLVNDAFFKKYYQKPTCELIQDAFRKDVIAADYYKVPDAKAELLKRFMCDATRL